MPNANSTGPDSEVQLAIQQTQKQSYALDAERAKLERQAARDQQKLLGVGVGLAVGFCMLFLFLPSPVTNSRQHLGLLIAVAIIVGSLVIPFLWPW